MNGEDDGDSWLLNGWEQQCAESIEEQPDHEHQLNLEADNLHRKVWTAFQDSATAIAQLYKDRITADPPTLWITFQTAAGTVTSLYKESCDSIRRSNEMSKQCGYQKRNRELLNWAKRKRTLIRREDLLSYLSGKPPPPRRDNLHHAHRLSPRPRNISPPPGITQTHNQTQSDDSLNTFTEALARSTTRCTLGGSDLCAFITGEIQRHTSKRPASPSDVTMGSPSSHQKRPRYM